jgi:hypothetical protein
MGITIGSREYLGEKAATRDVIIMMMMMTTTTMMMITTTATTATTTEFSPYNS